MSFADVSGFLLDDTVLTGVLVRTFRTDRRPAQGYDETCNGIFGMSFTKNDRNFRSESGKTFPSGSNTDETPPFEALISQALQREFGLTPASVKAVAKLADANERAVRNWFEGRNGPNGEHLVSLMRHSSAVLATVLNLAGRQDLTVGLIVSEARQRVCNALAALDAVADRDGQHSESP